MVELKWGFITAGVVYSAPAIGADGTLYFGATDSRLYAVDSEGELLWTFDAGGPVVSTPAIGPDGILFVTTQGGEILAVDKNGVLRWSFSTRGTPVSTSPVVGEDGTIYVGISAFLADGTQKWQQEGWGVFASTAIGPDGTIYGATNYGGLSSPDYLYAMDAQGVEKWSFRTDWRPTSPAVGEDGTVYVACTNAVGQSYQDTLYALRKDGSLLWTFVLPDDGGDIGIRSSPTIDWAGTIYLNSPNRTLFAINPDGTLKWEYSHSGDIGRSPTIGGDGTIYMPTDDLLALNPDGSLKWRLELDAQTSSNVAIGGDGVLYFGSTDGMLYAVGPGGTGVDYHPPIAGHCGMEGLWVWCNSVVDCYNYVGHSNSCDALGYCFHAFENGDTCTLSPGAPCTTPDRYCNWHRKCTRQCDTHDDCYGGQCTCRDGYRLCSYSMCEDEACPPNTVPLEGTLVCQPEPGYLEGDCHGVQGVCDVGYEPVGVRGCVAAP